MGCILDVVVESCGVQVGEGQGRIKFLKRSTGRVSGLVIVSLKCSLAR